jgi:hypothetical protein
MMGDGMRDVWVTRRHDGVTELSPRLAPLDGEERLLVIVTIMLAAGCFFLAGVMPAPVLGALFATCVAGELVLGVKALLLLLLRAPAEVHEIPSRHLHRRAR